MLQHELFVTRVPREHRREQRVRLIRLGAEPDAAGLCLRREPVCNVAQLRHGCVRHDPTAVEVAQGMVSGQLFRVQMMVHGISRSNAAIRIDR
jgi:hypothetical protein